MSNSRIEQKLLLAGRIITLRAQLAEAEAEFEGREPERQHAAPSVSARVLNLIQQAGGEGLTRSDLRTVIPTQDSAVQAALKTHAQAGRIQSVDGRWKAL